MKTKTLIATALFLSATLLIAADAKVPVDFVTQIKPILADRCVECHNSDSLFGELNLQSRALAFRKRQAGPVILPSEPDKSMLYLVLKMPRKEKKSMPATGHKIPNKDLDLIRRWISEGAMWPEGKEGAVIRQIKTPTPPVKQKPSSF
ncbi:MAG: hypothetical protein KDK97_05385 [Verrucomicrobiales bacterium]|nr:hypothetical protein [Verrucomicrobiales bacterium]